MFQELAAANIRRNNAVQRDDAAHDELNRLKSRPIVRQILKFLRKIAQSDGDDGRLRHQGAGAGAKKELKARSFLPGFTFSQSPIYPPRAYFSRPEVADAKFVLLPTGSSGSFLILPPSSLLPIVLLY